MLVTAFNATILATGRTVTHNLGVTPDFISVLDMTGTGGTWGMSPSVITYNATTVTIAGRVDGATVRVKCENFTGATIVASA